MIHIELRWDFHVVVFQPQPHFQSLFKSGQNPSSSSSANPASGPLSYADFVVQSKSNGTAAPRRELPSKLLRTENAGAPSLKKSESVSVSFIPGGCETAQDSARRTEGGSERVQMSEATQEAGTDQKDGSCQRSDPSLSLAPKPVGSGGSIIVSPRQVCIKMHTDFGNYTVGF